MMFTSTRPDCPVCKNSLIGLLNKNINNTKKTVCVFCGARVFMTENWDVFRAEAHYRSDGEIIK